MKSRKREREERRETALERLSTRPDAGARKPARGAQAPREERRDEPRRPRTSNVWMAPGARPQGKGADRSAPAPGKPAKAAAKPGKGSRQAEGQARQGWQARQAGQAEGQALRARGPAAIAARTAAAGAMRIVGGEFSGRPLAAPASAAIRPTSDRTREALFNVLSHRHADKLAGRARARPVRRHRRARAGGAVARRRLRALRGGQRGGPRASSARMSRPSA